ncbi:MAG: hypothetical protein FJX55_05490 [Alphaproteobacteria bacterium]|nr:hypothetical protein [Alphaproteobacteria bacterium]
MYILTGSPGMFAGVASLVYFLFIVAATLRLKFALPAFTGAVAALQYLALAWWLLPLDFASPDLLLTPQYHVGKGLVMVAAGSIAGLVGQRLRGQLVRLLEEMRARERVTSVFGQHVSPAVAERLIHSGEAPGEPAQALCSQSGGGAAVPTKSLTLMMTTAGGAGWRAWWRPRYGRRTGRPGIP